MSGASMWRVDSRGWTLGCPRAFRHFAAQVMVPEMVGKAMEENNDVADEA